LRQISEQLELGVGEIEVDAVDCRGVAGLVDEDTPGLDRRLSGGAGRLRGREPDSEVDLGRSGGGQQDVVEAPVAGEGGETAFAGHDQQRRLLASGIDRPAQGPGFHQVATGIEQEDVA
jgi:hypothetical protein